MRQLKRYAILLIFVLFFQISFSIGVFENDGSFKFYTNTSTPNINISLSSPLEEINITNATLQVNGVSNTVILNDFIPRAQEKNYFFTLAQFNQQNISSQDEVYFQLNAVGRDNRDVRTSGDKTNFDIIVDKIKPILQSPSQDEILQYTQDTQNLDLVFSEPILSYRVYLNENLIYSYRENRRLLSQFESSFNIPLNLDNLQDGLNQIKVVYEDIAQNKQESTINFGFTGVDLELDLLTSKDDPDLNYFFDKDNLNFFNKSIYTSQNNFPLKIKTNKPSKCYYSDSLLRFNYLDTLNQNTKNLFNTNDKLNHEININMSTSKKTFYVACENDIYPSETVYLSSELGLGETLLDFRLYENDPINIDSLSPLKLISSSPVILRAETSVEGICSFSLNQYENEILDSRDFIQHTKQGVEFNSGSNNLDLSCFDKLGRTAEISREITLDEEGGVQVFPQNMPLYSAYDTYNLVVSLSESADCRYSPTSLGDVSEFEGLEQSQLSEGLNREFSISGLTNGDNPIFIFCEKNGQVSESSFNILYDSQGPSLSNLSFINNGISSDYLGSNTSLEFEVETTSIIPVSKYFVELRSDSLENYNQEFSQGNGRINEYLVNYSQISIIAQNDLGINSSPIQKDISFDFQKPEIEISKQSGEITLSCFDSQSGCLNIKYGFSSTRDLCSASKTYINQTLDFSDKDFICVKAQDNVGNQDSLTQSLLEDIIVPEVGNSSNQSDLENVSDLNSSNSNISSNQTQNDTELFEPDFEDKLPPSQDSNNTILIISAIILLLATTSGGSYYAYKKGYLDNQLLKYGIIKNKNKNNNNTSSQSIKNQNTNMYGSKKNQNNRNNKSSYNDRLKKLNAFVDDTLDSNNGVFDNFKTYDNKGKVEGYDDTLTKKPENYTKKSKKDLDEFYDSSSLDKYANEASIEEESEKFEEFYKKKQEAQNQKKQTNKKK